MRITEIQQQVGRGQYQVDAHAVAEAIVRRLFGAGAPATPTKPAQGECS